MKRKQAKTKVKKGTAKPSAKKAKPALKAKAKAKAKPSAKKPATKKPAAKKPGAKAKPVNKPAAKAKPPAKPAAKTKASTGAIQRSSKLKGTTAVDPSVESLAAIIGSHPGAGNTDGSVMLPSIELDGHLDVDSRLFVIGDVKVTGAIRIGEMCSLFVGGNVTCANFFAEGDFQCTELSVTDTLFGNYEAGITMAQKASGKLWLEGSHDFEFEEDEFEDKHSLYEYKPSEEPKTLPAGHKLSPTAIELLITKPQAYWEGKGPGVSGEEWWKLLVAGGAST